MSGTVAAEVELPEASIIYVPPATLGTVKVELQPPTELTEILPLTTVSLKVTLTPFSLAANPLPVTVTCELALPEVRLAVIFGVTLKVAVPEPLVPPVAVTVWLPEYVAGTVKEVENVVALIVKPATTVVESKVIETLSEVVKLAPVTVTASPTLPEYEERVIVGVTV